MSSNDSTHENLPEVAKRFLRYVVLDTQSAEGATGYPSTEKQKDLGRLLEKELSGLGLEDVRMDSWGYVTATLPASTKKKVPTIGLIAHMDTSPEVSGAGVKPVIHRNYRGGPIELPGDPQQVLSPDDSEDLKKCEGHDIITSDGTTLLGADNKAGIAEIITAVSWLLDHPEVTHGRIRIGFTCDEEVGRGTEHFDVKDFGADFAYTVDGEAAGQIENETFCADAATVTFVGRNMHPGYAKGKLANSMKGAAAFIDRLPADQAPETTEGRQGYLHPTTISGAVERTVVKLIVRDFEEDGLSRLERQLEELVEETRKAVPGVSIEVELKEQYRNMRTVLDTRPEVIEHAMEAVRRVGAEPFLSHIRGGTDGARLSYKGLLTPNLFTGGHNFHSRTEWISVQDMELAVRTLVELVQVWEERG